MEDVLQHGHRTPWSFPLPSHRSPAFFSAAIISVKSVKLSAPPRTAAKHTLASALVFCSILAGIFGLGWSGRSGRRARGCVRAPRGRSSLVARFSISIPRKPSNIPGIRLAGLVICIWKISNVTTPILEPSASWNHQGPFQTWFILRVGNLNNCQ